LLRRLAEPSAVVAIWQEDDEEDMGEPAVSIIRVLQDGGEPTVVVGTPERGGDKMTVRPTRAIPMSEIEEVKGLEEDQLVVVQTKSKGTLLIQVQDADAMRKWGLGLHGLHLLHQRAALMAQAKAKPAGKAPPKPAAPKAASPAGKAPAAASSSSSSPGPKAVSAPGAAAGLAARAGATEQAMAAAQAVYSQSAQAVEELVRSNQHKDAMIKQLEAQLEQCLQVVQRSARLFAEQEKVVNEQDALIQGLTRMVPSLSGRVEDPGVQAAEADVSSEEEEEEVEEDEDEDEEDDEGGSEGSEELEALQVKLDELLKKKAAAEEMLAQMERARSAAEGDAGRSVHFEGDDTSED